MTGRVAALQRYPVKSMLGEVREFEMNRKERQPPLFFSGFRGFSPEKEERLGHRIRGYPNRKSAIFQIS